MYCRNCGKEIKDGNTFCTNCGKKIYTQKVETNKNTINIKFNYILIIIAVILIIVGTSIFLLYKDSKHNNDINTIQTNVVYENKEIDKNNVLNQITETKLDKLTFNVKLDDSGNMQVSEIWNIEIQDINTLFKTFTLDKNKYDGISKFFANGCN